MELDPTLRDNISTGEYEAGHMMYVHNQSLDKMQSDVAKFYASALGS
jgi:carboxypeptidase C (cathepsin A)